MACLTQGIKIPSSRTEDDDGSAVSPAKSFCFWTSDDAMVAYLIT